MFVRAETSWSQQAKLTASDAALGDHFGGSVVVSGDTAVVGSPGNESAYVFVPSATSSLSVVREGTGTGTVTSDPAGIACGADCEEDFAEGATVTLTATPDAGSTFGGFGGCDSVTGNQCTVVVDAATTVTATFTLPTSPPTSTTSTLLPPTTTITTLLPPTSTTSTTLLPPTTTTTALLPPTTTTTALLPPTSTTTTTLLPPTTSSTTLLPPTTSSTTMTTRPSGRIRLDDRALSNGRVMRVRGTFTCDRGSPYRIMVSVTQGETEVRGVQTGECRGSPQFFKLIATVVSGPGFSSGPAQASARAQITAPATGVDSFGTTEDLDIRVRRGLFWAGEAPWPPWR